MVRFKNSVRGRICNNIVVAHNNNLNFAGRPHLVGIKMLRQYHCHSVECKIV